MTRSKDRIRLQAPRLARNSFEAGRLHTRAYKQAYKLTLWTLHDGHLERRVRQTKNTYSDYCTVSQGRSELQIVIVNGV